MLLSDKQCYGKKSGSAPQCYYQRGGKMSVNQNLKEAFHTSGTSAINERFYSGLSSGTPMKTLELLLLQLTDRFRQK